MSLHMPQVQTKTGLQFIKQTMILANFRRNLADDVYILRIAVKISR